MRDYVAKGNFGADQEAAGPASAHNNGLLYHDLTNYFRALTSETYIPPMCFVNIMMVQLVRPMTYTNN